MTFTSDADIDGRPTNTSRVVADIEMMSDNELLEAQRIALLHGRTNGIPESANFYLLVVEKELNKRTQP